MNFNKANRQFNILIADDDYQIRRMAQKILEQMGHKVVALAANGQEALTLLQEHRPDVVLMDVDMPVMNGIEATHRAQQCCPTPVVMITASAGPDIIDRASEAGAGAYLVKPFTPQDLEPAIAVAVSRFSDMITLRRLNKKLTRLNEALITEQDKSERLLLNILPRPIAERLKQQPGIIADDFAEATVLFADLVGFTRLSATISSTTLVEMLNEIFSTFDRLAQRHDLEKIKTIGDSYMLVGGVPLPREDHAAAVADLALDILAEMPNLPLAQKYRLQVRIGLSLGPVTAGVIGRNKFAYDIWGDTVNVASRMEMHGQPGKIHVTQAVYQALRHNFEFEARGQLEIKGKGPMNTWFLTGRR